MQACESNFRTYLHKCTSFHSIYNLREFVHLVNSVTKVAMKYERLYGEIWKCLASGLREHWNFSNVCIWMLKNYAFPSNTFPKLPTFNVAFVNTIHIHGVNGIMRCEKLINIRLLMFIDVFLQLRHILLTFIRLPVYSIRTNYFYYQF